MTCNADDNNSVIIVTQVSDAVAELIDGILHTTPGSFGYLEKVIDSTDIVVEVELLICYVDSDGGRENESDISRVYGLLIHGF